MKENYVFIGKFVGIYKFSHQLILAHLPLDKKKLEISHFFININHQFIPYFIKSIKIIAKDTSFISIEDINTFEQAQEFLKANIYLKDTIFKSIFKTTENKLIGFSVFDIHNKLIGQIIDTNEIGGQNMLTVQVEKKEVLIPLHKENILQVNDTLHRIQLEIAEGLLDL